MRKDKVWNIEKEFLQKTIDESSSYREICEKLNLIYSRTQLKMIYYRTQVEELSLIKFRENYKKIKGGWNGKKYKLDEILIINSKYLHTSNLKSRLFGVGIFENKCSECGITEWNGKEIVCQLDHINGVSNDNRIENLRILCPNCHTQTETYSNKRFKKIKEKKHLIYCKNCKNESNGKVFCDSCQEKISFSNRKIDRPNLEKLLEDIKELGYSGTGRKYGVSDNAIRKWIKI